MPMQGKKSYQEKLFTSFKLSERVSKEIFTDGSKKCSLPY